MTSFFLGVHDETRLKLMILLLLLLVSVFAIMEEKVKAEKAKDGLAVEIVDS